MDLWPFTIITYMGLIHDGEFPTPAEHESTHPKKTFKTYEQIQYIYILKLLKLGVFLH